MSDNIGDKQRIEHIYEAILHIENFIQGVDYDEYMRNFQLRLALVKLLEIVGEASGVLSDGLKTNFSEVEWRTLKAVRNILVHEYFGINYEVIWASIQRDIPPLKQKIEIIRTSYRDD